MQKKLKDESEKSEEVLHPRNQMILTRKDASHAESVYQNEKRLNRQFFKRFPRTGNFVAADAQALPFPDDTFDFSWSSKCIDYLRLFGGNSLEQAVSEIIRVTKPGGQIQIAGATGDSPIATLMLGELDVPIKQMVERNKCAELSMRRTENGMHVFYIRK